MQKKNIKYKTIASTYLLVLIHIFFYIAKVNIVSRKYIIILFSPGKVITIKLFSVTAHFLYVYNEKYFIFCRAHTLKM